MTDHPMAWAAEGACRGEDLDLFFPVQTTLRHDRVWPEELVAPARAICAPCPVFVACHQWALLHEGEGIWAGTDPNARKRLRRALGIELQQPRPIDQEDLPT